MAITERTEIDQIEIVGPFRIMQVRTAVIVERDGVEIARSLSREVLDPDADLSTRPAFAQAIGKAAWTPEIKAAFIADKAAAKARDPK